MPTPLVKAFILCQDGQANADQQTWDIVGAGLHELQVRAGQSFPLYYDFSVFAQLSDLEEGGSVGISLRRADSGRAYHFRAITIQHVDRVKPSNVCVRLRNCQIPSPGVYFIELWYDGEWLVDQRLEVLEEFHS